MSENLTPEVLADLKAKALKAAKVVPGRWQADSEKNDGEYGSAPESRVGFNSYALFNEKGQRILDGSNSEVAEIYEDEELAWDETGSVVFDFLEASDPSVILSLLTALEEAEARIEDLTNKLDDERENYGNAEAEAKDDAATIAAMVKALTDPRGEPEDYDPWPIQRAEDLMRAYLANQAALSALQQENERLRGVMAGCSDALKIEARANEMSANIMRDPVRTGGWSGAENTARAFDRHGLKAAGIRATLLSALQAPQSQGGEADDR